MSILSKLFAKTAARREIALQLPKWYLQPEKLENYPSGNAELVQFFLTGFSELIERENKCLAELGLPIPTIEQPVSFKPTITTYEKSETDEKDKKNEYYFTPFVILMPRFKIPLYRFYAPVRLVHLQMYYAAPLQKPTGLFIAPSVTDSEDKEGLLQSSDDWYKKLGLLGVMKVIGGDWYSRDPYALYNYLQDPAFTQFAVRDPMYIDPNDLETFTYDTRENNQIFVGDNLKSLPLKAISNIARPDLLQDTQRIFSNIRLSHPIEKVNIPSDQIAELIGLAQAIASKATNDAVTAKPSTNKEYERWPFALEISSYDIDIYLPKPARNYGEQYKLVKILLTPAVEQKKVAQWLHSLPGISYPIIFKIVAEQSSIYFEFGFHPEDEEKIMRQFEIHLPEFAIIEHRESFINDAVARDNCLMFAVEPTTLLTAFQAPKSDLYAPLLHVLSEIDAPGFACVQFVCFPITTAGMNILTFCFSEYIKNDPDLERAMQKQMDKFQKKTPAYFMAAYIVTDDQTHSKKITDAFFKPVQSSEQQWQISKYKAAALVQGNNLNFPMVDSWCIVNTDELSLLVNFPANGAIYERLETSSMKAKLPPESYSETGIVLGEATARGITKPVTIPYDVRPRHLYIVGKSGVGKSTLVFNAATQDIANGYGVCVIDPHGDLVEDLLHTIPEHRIKDTIYFDASDRKHPIPVNIMNAQDEDEIGILADDLLVTFKRLSESWGERMENLLRYVFHTLLRVPDATFVDIQTILQNEDYRQRILSKIDFPPLVDFWKYQFPQLPKDATQPILNRMSKFTLSPVLYGILGKSESYLNFYDVLQNKKILLVNLSQGKMGEDTSKLLGSLLVSQLQLNVMRRAGIAKEQREPFMLYVDEFQNFTTSAFEKILSEARKYKLCLTLAHQYTSQLDEKTRLAILNNVGTSILFELGTQDANAFRGQIGQYEPADILSLSTVHHEALCKPATQTKDTFKFNTRAPIKAAQSFAQTIIEHTWDNYCTTATMTPLVDEEDAVTSPPLATVAVPGTEPTPATVVASGSPVKVSRKVPSPALPKDLPTAKDRILYFIEQAGYLTNPQIVSLCYSHLAEGSKAPAASRDLKALIEDKKLKVQPHGKSKIYYTGREPSPPSHNVRLRDLYVKIVNSGYEIAEVKFFSQLGGLNPDLAVTFVADDGSQYVTYWEYDAGTENVSELVKKVDRYRQLLREGGGSLGEGVGVTFVFNTRERMVQVNRTIMDNGVTFAVLDEFTSLNDAVFKSASSDVNRKFFYS